MAGGSRSGSNTRSAKQEEEYLEQLISKVCTNFTNQLEEKLDLKVKQLDAKLSQVCDSLKNINILVNNNVKDIKELQQRCETLEQQSKRNSLRLCGFNETEGENLSQSLASFFEENLKINCASNEIDFAFRLRKFENNRNAPRPIIVNFVRNIKRNEVMAAKKLLKNTPFTIYEDLTRENYELLISAKKKYGQTKAWSTGGKIFIWNAAGNNKVHVKSRSDI
ncbi:hypothetical protein NQ317_003180 [Molorchus minor]|uniref:Uncharacterized protein n=1 Tax=Molorchus minor TaxID=1323400 RepID=A0ABQ9IX34_9CUCU|nr:hypothetical protein NQ317_003180 [Molorchus minor]